MAKRKRLSPAVIAPGASEGLSDLSREGLRRPPIADVTGDAAERAAFEEVTQELRTAREEGRMVVSLPLEAVDAGHLVRDRVTLDPEEMAVLMDSLRARGQQTPIEVLDLGQGSYGLISGWRRLKALRALRAETGGQAFTTVRAFLRQPGDVGGTYLAMVEENEIRADLSFYERARIAVQAAGAGVFADTHTAVQTLFAAARPPKRSKIMAFTRLVEELDTELRFPAAIPEKVGLALGAALQEDARFRRRLLEALRRTSPADAVAERRVLDACLKPSAKPAGAPEEQEVSPGLRLRVEKGRAVLSGPAVTPELTDALRRWLAEK